MEIWINKRGDKIYPRDAIDHKLDSYINYLRRNWYYSYTVKDCK